MTLPDELAKENKASIELKAKTEFDIKKFIDERVMGKPEKIAYEFAEKELKTAFYEIYKNDDEFELGDIFMVGDNPLSDIIGGKNYGWKTCLVRTGVYTDDYELKVQPTYIVDTVKDAVLSGLKESSVDIK